MKRDRWPPRRPPEPRPAGGIRARGRSDTWWGQRWIGALERMSTEYENRLGRGRTYARKGLTHDFEVRSGKIAARVQGSRVEPYQVDIELPPLTDAAWSAAIDAMAQRARFSAELLSGAMPGAIDEAFDAADAHLFPRDDDELFTDCTCPDWAVPCKHIAAVHYVFADALDRDPFLLFQVRGRTKAQVLEALRAARGRLRAPASGTEPADDEPGAAPQDALTRIDEERAPEAVALPTMSDDAFQRLRAPLPDLSFDLASPRVSGALLRQLETPPGWDVDATVVDWLAPLVEHAGELARDLALDDDLEDDLDD